MGMCVVNAAEAAAYIGHAVISTRAAVFNCGQKATNASQEGDIKAVCSADVSEILQSFFLVAAYLANAATLCGNTVIVGAECANRITSVLAGFMEISAGGSGAHVDCRSQDVNVAPHGNRERPNGA